MLRKRLKIFRKYSENTSEKAPAPAGGLPRFRDFPPACFGARKIHGALRAGQRERLFNAAYTMAAFISLQEKLGTHSMASRSRENEPAVLRT